MQIRVSPNRLQCSAEEWQARIDLAAAHRLAVMHGFSEGIFNHLTLTMPGRSDRYYQIPFGTHWSEVTAAARLSGLPHARAHRSLEPRCQRVDAGHQPDEGLWRGEPTDQAAADARSGPRRAAGGLPQDGGISRDHEFERDRSLAICAQDAAAPDRPLDACDRHRIRRGPTDHRASRRRAR